MEQKVFPYSHLWRRLEITVRVGEGRRGRRKEKKDEWSRRGKKELAQAWHSIHVQSIFVPTNQPCSAAKRTMKYETEIVTCHRTPYWGNWFSHGGKKYFQYIFIVVSELWCLLMMGPRCHTCDRSWKWWPWGRETESGPGHWLPGLWWSTLQV